jgi:PAS domain S-box-containing protein
LICFPKYAKRKSNVWCILTPAGSAGGLQTEKTDTPRSDGSFGAAANVLIGREGMNPIKDHSTPSNYGVAIICLLALPVIYLITRYNYNLFHSFADGASIIIAASAFTVIWNSRNRVDNDYFVYAGIAFLFFAFLDFLHLLGNKNMGIFPEYGNLGPTFYIASRYVLSISLLIAPLFINRKLNTALMFVVYSLASLFILLSIFYWEIFPVCLVEGVGLTPFKIISDYIICLIFLASIGLLLMNRQSFDSRVLKLIVSSSILFIATGLTFTLYTDPFGITNMAGHLFQIASFYLVYLAFIETSVTQPQEILFRKLKQSEEKLTGNLQQLDHVNAELKQEIGERKRAEEASRENEARLSFALETIHAGAWDLDLVGHSAFRSLEHDRIFGYAELLQEWTYEMLLEHVLPEDREMVDRKFRQAMGNRGDWNFECRIRRADGQIRWIWATGRHTGGSAGDPTRMAGIVQDITDRKRAEKALRESEERYRNLVKYAPAAIYEMDPRGTKFFSVSDVMCSTLRYSREELLSMKPVDLLDRESRSIFEERSRKKIAGEAIDESMEYRARRKDGEWIHISANVRTHDYDSEPPAKIAVVSYDITERKKMEMELKRRTVELEAANKELESFSYSVSHDLRAPLRAIDGYSRMILRQGENSLDEKTRSLFNVIIDNTKMMGQLINDLLALSRLGREALSPSNVNVEDLARDVWEELKAGNPGGFVDLKIDPVPPATADRSLIKQVLLNILSNAIKFSRNRKAPLIEVGGYTAEKENIYYVRDNGVGFDMQYGDKLFGVFQRLHTDVDFEGTGVGLAIVQRIILRHGGRVWAEGEPDKGATFYFSLPVNMGSGL